MTLRRINRNNMLLKKYNRYLNTSTFLKQSISVNTTGGINSNSILNSPTQFPPLFLNQTSTSAAVATSSLSSSHINTTPTMMLNDPFTGSHAAAVTTMGERRDIMKLWSLLEVCLQTNNQQRAFSILTSLYEIKSHRISFIEDYNLYLNSLANNKNFIKDYIQLEKTLENDLNTFFPTINYNDKTLAILTHHAIRLNQINTNKKDNNKLFKHINTYFKMSNNDKKYNVIKNICSYVDILTINDYKVLFNELKLIQENDIPKPIRKLVTAQDFSLPSSNTSNISDSNENTNNKNNLETSSLDGKDITFDDDIRTLDKNATNLRNVDTVGMKVVRHALLGLSLTDEQKDKIANLKINNNESNILNLNENQSIDFFQIYNSLEDENERKKFDEILSDFNQDRQRALEVRATDAAKQRWQHDFEEAKLRGDISIQKSLNAKLWNWYTKMLPLLREEVIECNNKFNGKNNILPTRSDYMPYLNLVDPEKMCVITILELLKLNSTGGIIEGMRTARAVISVGKAIELEFRSEQLLKNESRIFKEVNKKSNEFKKYVRNAKTAFRSMDIEKSKVVWPQSIRAEVGSILISILMKVAKVDVEGIDPVSKEKVFGKAPAFSHSYQYHNGSKLGIIKIHKVLINQLNGDRLIASVQPQLLPMLVEPRRWKNWKSGGYYYSQSLLVRSRDCPEELAYLEAASNTNSINQVYEGLNVLGETAWTVNRKTFDIISQVWNEGKDFLDIPGVQEKLELLPPPPRDSDPSVINEWKNKNKSLANEYSANRSVRCDSNYKLEIARAFLGEKLYFPHNLDFRGRAYPLSPHFNHLGNDMSRGLLIFWKGKRLGKAGFKWLKVHLANLFGIDKVSIEDRLAFIEERLEEVKDSAERPLDGKCWWQKADKPWQALATCIEINEALKLDNPEDFISHQPVHQDGTCNGLQHYAALGGDVEGAQQVNLVPGSKPRDVYSHVADLVKARLKNILAKEEDPIARFLVDKLNRKVVKQTVMTHVYGVTLIGATLQIDKQLSDNFDDKKESMGYSKYLAKHVFAAIKESFEGAHLIQDWLGECSKRISKAVRLDVDEKSFKSGDKPDFMTSIIWTSPLGLPIVQPYREMSKKQIYTNLQSVYISDPFAVNQVNARRQKAGFPPNFIHSLDASHMLLSATECAKAGLDFASVHDSYWTHACDIEVMNKILREQFIKLHEVDLIERLKEEFDERYKSYVQITRIPKKSDLAKNIIKFRADLSKQLGRPAKLADEISLERSRQTLLKSASEDKVKLGKQMVTTISLVESAESLEEFEEEDSKGLAGLAVLVPLRMPDIPPKGDFDVHEVKDSTYFFS